MAMKKLTYTLTVYMNSGFNSIDRPLTPSVLENATKNTYADVYYLREDIDKPTIVVNDNYNALVDADYVKLVSNDVTKPNTFYYAVTAVHALSGNSVSLTLDLDALLTMGGVSNLSPSGYQVRGHISRAEDVLFGNTLAEDFVPAQPLKTSPYYYVNGNDAQDLPTTNRDFQIVLSNIDLVKLGDNVGSSGNTAIDIIAGIDGNGSEVMYVPKILSNNPDDSTEFVLNGLRSSEGSITGEKHSLKMPSVKAYVLNPRVFDPNNPTKVFKGIQVLHSCGQLQLIGSYTLPKEWLVDDDYDPSLAPDHTWVTNENEVKQLVGALKGEDISNLPYEYTPGSGYTIKNKKVYMMFRNYTLLNVASGSMVITPIAEMKYVRNGVTMSYPIVKLWSDVTSMGKPYAKFITDLDKNAPFANIVSGSNWVNNGIILDGASGSLLNNVNNAFAQQEIQKSASQQRLNYGVTKGMISAGYDILAATQKGQALSDFGASASALANINSGASAMSAAGAIGGRVANALWVQQDINKASLEMLGYGQERAYYDNAFAEQRFENQAARNRVQNAIANQVVAPTSIYMPDPSLAMYGLNKFICYETMLSDDDVRELDYYFQRFGYNMHKKLDSTSFDKRDYYTYVQAYDINIKSSGSFGLRVRQKGIAQLASGQRFWKVLPDPSYYESN